MTSKKILAVILAAVMLVPMFMLGANAENAEYTIVSPYKDVIWEGDNAWGAYKGTLHTHTTYSDAELDLPIMIKGYYNEDYDFVANADHGVTGVEWNKEPARPILYLYQYILGNKVNHLTDEEYEAITTGTYPLEDGTIRNKKMVCVTGANELGYITLTKSHTNGYFLPADVGNEWDAGENSFEAAVKFVDENGGLSHINHPGDWLDSNSNPDAVNDPENIEYFADILIRYDSCYGIEVFNEDNGPTGYDRILWDNLLMYSLPYGKTILGYANTDAHSESKVDSSFMTFMMEENNVENIRKTMTSGAFFSTTRNLRANDYEIGPKVAIDADNLGLAYPTFTKLVVDGHKITVKVADADYIQWIADGKVIYSADITTDDEIVLDLDTIEGAENFLYVRAEIIGEGGITLTQALTIDNGSEPLEYSSTEESFITKFIKAFTSSLLYVIFQEIIRAI